MSAQISSAQSKAVGPNKKGDSDGTNICYFILLFSDNSNIYINQQHPLYQREAKKPDTYMLNVTRLIAQEISLMKDTRNSRQAFLRQR
jgi:hypothetical protein